MPRNTGEVRHLHMLPLGERRRQDGRFQAHWYHHMADLGQLFPSVIDVGAGSGYGVDIMIPHFIEVGGVDPLPLAHFIQSTPVEDLRDGAADLVTAMDVIEHVEDDAGFLAHLLRVARRAVFISTPNYNANKCINPYHVREYTPAELRDLLQGLDRSVFVSDEKCAIEPRTHIEDGEQAPNFGILIIK